MCQSLSPAIHLVRTSTHLRSEVAGNRISENIDLTKLEVTQDKVQFRDNEFSNGYNLLQDQHYQSKMYGLALNLLDLTGIILGERQLSGMITYGLVPVTRILAHYLMLSCEDMRNWSQDPYQYIEDDENEHDMSSIRVLTLQILSGLIERFPADGVKCIMSVIDTYLFGADDGNLKPAFVALLKKVPSMMVPIIKELHLEDLFDFDLKQVFGNSQMISWKRKEVALNLLGKFSSDILSAYNNDHKKQSSILIERLILLFGDKLLHPAGRRSVD